MNGFFNKILLGCSIVILSMIVVACSGAGEENGSADGDNEEVDFGDGDFVTSDDESLASLVKLDWASGPQGGIWYGAAGGLASLLGEYDNNLSVKAIPGGTVQNIPFVDMGEADIAWNFAFFANLAMKAEEPFDEVHDQFQAIGSGYGDSTFHFVVDGDSDYETVDDLFENGDIKIALTPASQSDDFIFQKMMEYYDTSYDEMETDGVSFFQGSYAEQAEQFKNGNVDAIFALSGLPASSITDASVSRDLKLLDFPEDLRDYLEQYNFVKKTIPKDTYTKAVNGNEEIEVMTAENVILVNNQVDEEVVYQMTKGMNENTDKFSAIHSSLEEYDINKATENLGDVELHPGAAKYYKEKGIIN